MSTGDPITPASAEPMQRTIEALAARNVEAVLLQSREAALTKLKERVPEGSEVFVNTSETLTTIGYTEYAYGNDRYVNLHDRMMAQPDPAAQREFRRKTTTADYFVGSVQAIAETGEIVIASSSGKQIGASPAAPAASSSWPARRRSAPRWPKPRPAPAAGHWSATTAGWKTGGCPPHP